MVEIQGHVDLGNAVFLDDGPELVERAQDLDPAVDLDLRPLRDRVVHEAQDPESQVPEAGQLLGDGLPHVARADDEDVGQVHPPGVPALHEEIDLVPEDEDDEDDGHEIDGQEAVGELEGHPVDGRLPLAVVVKIVQDGKDHEDGQDAVDGSVKEIVDAGAAELRSIEPLQIEDAQVHGQEQREDDDVGPERRDPPGGIDGNDVGVEAEEVGIEVGEQDGQAIADRTNSPMSWRRFSLIMPGLRARPTPAGGTRTSLP